jgi:hypothetical protein
VKGSVLTVAVDFDGTVVEHRFPAIGAGYPGAVDVLRWVRDRGHELILFTCREDTPGGRAYLSEAVAWLANRGVAVDAVNANGPRGLAYCEKHGVPVSRKPLWDMLIDDTAGFSPRDWPLVKLRVKELEDRGLIMGSGGPIVASGGTGARARAHRDGKWKQCTAGNFPVRAADWDGMLCCPAGRTLSWPYIYQAVWKTDGAENTAG